MNTDDGGGEARGSDAEADDARQGRQVLPGWRPWGEWPESEPEPKPLETQAEADLKSYMRYHSRLGLIALVIGGVVLLFGFISRCDGIDLSPPRGDASSTRSGASPSPGAGDLAELGARPELAALYSRAAQDVKPVVDVADGWVYEAHSLRLLDPQDDWIGTRPGGSARTGGPADLSIGASAAVPASTAGASDPSDGGDPTRTGAALVPRGADVVLVAEVEARPGPQVAEGDAPPSFRWQLFADPADRDAVYTEVARVRTMCPTPVGASGSPVAHPGQGGSEQSEAVPGKHTLCWRLLGGLQPDALYLGLVEPGFDDAVYRTDPVPTSKTAVRFLRKIELSSGASAGRSATVSPSATASIAPSSPGAP